MKNIKIRNKKIKNKSTKYWHQIIIKNKIFSMKLEIHESNFFKVLYLILLI